MSMEHMNAALESISKLAKTLKEERDIARLERDKAREALSAAKHYLTKERDDALSQIVQAECRAERFCQERDEARVSLDEVRKSAEYYRERYEQLKNEREFEK